MSYPKILRSILLGATASGLSILVAAPKVELPLMSDFNMFEVGAEVKLKAVVSGIDEEQQLDVRVVDYYGEEVLKKTIDLDVTDEGEAISWIDLSELSKGYYEVNAQVGDGTKGAGFTSLGVVHFLNRSAKEAREGGYRFGLKIGGTPRNFDMFGAMDVAARLGLQWTRYTFHRDDIDELHKLPVNIIYKVEGFPPEAYDEERYGPREKFRLRHFGWMKASVPKKEPFKKYIRDLISTFPENQNVFEIWNEPWGKYAPEDFADMAQWAKEAILEVRPNAILGPNLGHLNYDAPFLEAGGMEGMNTLFLHPYNTPERSQKRAKIRSIRDFYAEHYGKPIDFYVTEFGAPSPPEGPAADQTEAYQVRRVLRDTFIFIAEDVKAFTPHVLGQRETSRTNGEDWYGFYRADGTPKPVLVAYANQAQLLDGGDYLGYIFYEPDVGAMLMKNKGDYVLSLWTNDLDRTVEVETGVESVTMVDTVGHSRKLATPDGKVTLDLTGDPVYLVGVSSQLAQVAQEDPIDGLWQEGLFVRNSREIHKMKVPPAIDGKNIKEEFAGQTQIPMSIDGVDPENISATGYISWDEDHLYVAVEVMDDDPCYNPNKRLSIYDADSLELWFCSDLKYQVPLFLHTHDSQMLFSPTSITGEPQAGIVNSDAKKLDYIDGLKMKTICTENGWNLEMAIPKEAFYQFDPKVGLKGALEMRVNDGDRSRPKGRNGRFKANPTDGGKASHTDASLWSVLEFVE